MSRLIWIYSVCPLVFDFQHKTFSIKSFSKFCRRNFVVCFFGALRVNSKVSGCLKLQQLYDPRRRENRSSGFPIRSDTNRAVQPMRIARGLKFRIWKEEGLYYLYSKNKGADQLCGYRTADLRLCFCIYAKCRFSHDAAHTVFTLAVVCPDSTWASSPFCSPTVTIPGPTGGGKL